jgi:hypothetical protein
MHWTSLGNSIITTFILILRIHIRTFGNKQSDGNWGLVMTGPASNIIQLP